MSEQISITRRSILAGGLVIGFSLRGVQAQQSGNAQEPQNQGVKPEPFKDLPGSLKTTPYIDSWIRIAGDGITVVTGKVELGQGIKTAILQVAAEELGAELAQLSLQTGDTYLTPNEGYTAGSQSMQESATAVRHAAAQAREILVRAAAQRWQLDASALSTGGGFVSAPDGRKASFFELASQTDLHIIAEPRSVFRVRGDKSLIGIPVQRVDIPAKLTGGMAYVQDLRLEGMLHARVLRPPSYGSSLASLDTREAEGLAGVLKIVRNGSFVAIVTEREEQSIRGLASLARNSNWSGATKLPSSDAVDEWLKTLPAEDYIIAENRTVVPAAGNLIEAAYVRPFQMHGSIGPSCAVALYEDGRWTIWTHSQGVYPLRDSLAAMLRTKPENVRCIHAEGSGCYGHNGADDVAADAAIIAREMPGRPVRVQWMREQEHAWEPFGSAMATSARAMLDESGRIRDWEYHVWSGTHLARPDGNAGNLMPSWHLQNPFELPIPKPLPQPAGGGDRNAIPLYSFPARRVVHHFIPRMPVRVSALRALGGYMNVFSIESFMDKLAGHANIDPIEFRLRHLADARGRDVIAMASEKFGWNGWRKQHNRHGRGFGFARYKNLAAYTAIALDLVIEPETGHVTVNRVVAANDSGEIVNPDGIRNQIEGGIIQSMSWTLNEGVAFTDDAIESRDWSTYPILRIQDLPASVDVHLIDRPGQPFLGTGEAAQGPMAAAIANAVANATGKRLRRLPLRSADISIALRS